MKPTFSTSLWLRAAALIIAHATGAFAATNVPPVVQVISAAMRPGTALMDVTYRITDPDDATVKVRALAFVNGVRSFSNVVRAVTFVEGTTTNIGDAITTGVDHTVTWDVRADWNIDLAQVKFEVLAVDSSGILPFQGISIPAASGNPELKINQIGITDAQVFNALLWLYASGNTNMEIASGTLMGSATSGVFKQNAVVVGATLDQRFAQPFLSKLLNISLAGTDILRYADAATRTTFATDKWLTTSWPYVGSQFVYVWGNGVPAPVLFCDVIAIAGGVGHSLALKDDGTVVGWGNARSTAPTGLSGVTAIAAGNDYSLALKNDGTVVGWGNDSSGTLSVPAGLSGVAAVAAGVSHCLALKNDGTVVAWGYNTSGELSVPAGLSNVVSIAANYCYSLALKSNGTVVAWGSSAAVTVPTGLAGVKGIAAGHSHCLALKNDGTVVAWGLGEQGSTTIPSGLSNVTAIAAGLSFSLALRNDGTLVAWGDSGYGKTAIPAGIPRVAKIAAGMNHCLAITLKAP